ncbi:type VI secretion system-associated FHA domain protein TagH [Massilia sp. CCM 8733]|uniref:Type VI secretion system-associated FHA domain protein TagH n=1 Tax=Massilia mucilaginosa TaxID=2609282 RepID=A0ABX0NRV8_9BURK|nr:type VI secretion system-associated FHA domain protein TagH [Massilia mucilaginosa]NHZ89587.1 type VI secretion system-associated FHA domain protein TagH [Massilia mucilaginosa]
MRLTILEHAGQPVRPPVGKDFSPPGATIGRGADNHLVLADDTRQISRLQASVRIDDSGTYLANLSTVCPVEVNDAALTGDQFWRLQDGDQVRIGLYLLQVGAQQAADAADSPPPVAEVEDAIATAPASVAPAPAPAATAAPDDAFWDNLVSDFAPAPSARLFAAAAPVPAPLAVAQAAAPEMLLPDDALATLSNPSVDPLDFFANPGAQSHSNLFADSASALPDTSTALLELAQQEQAACAPFDTSSLFGRAIAGGAQADPAPVQFAADIAPPVRTAARPPSCEPAPPTPDAASMVAAFLDGAGFTPNEGTLTDAHFHQAGRLLSKLVGGSMNLLTSRTIIKREVKAELTMMLDKENNPLKLLPDAKTVLKQMFGPPFPGFMTSERAVDDTFHDLQAHQMGMLAGMRAALNQLLRNFSPEVVDKQMGADVWYDRLMPKGRDGRAWVRYRALHQAAVTAVEEDFHTVFGQVFLSAYDAEVELYRAQRMQQAC